MTDTAAMLVEMTDGFTEVITATNNPWKAAQAFEDAGFGEVDACECVQNGHYNAVLPENVKGKKVIGGYSFGGSSNEIVTNHWKDCDALVNFLVLAVPDAMKGQHGSWILAPKSRTFCFQLGPDQSFPVSEPVFGAPWIEIDDPKFFEAVARVQVGGGLNISCKNIAKPIAWWQQILFPVAASIRIENHTNVMNNTVLINAMVLIAKMFVGAST